MTPQHPAWTTPDTETEPETRRTSGWNHLLPVPQAQGGWFTWIFCAAFMAGIAALYSYALQDAYGGYSLENLLEEGWWGWLVPPAIGLGGLLWFGHRLLAAGQFTVDLAADYARPGDTIRVRVRQRQGRYGSAALAIYLTRIEGFRRSWWNTRIHDAFRIPLEPTETGEWRGEFTIPTNADPTREFGSYIINEDIYRIEWSIRLYAYGPGLRAVNEYYLFTLLAPRKEST